MEFRKDVLLGWQPWSVSNYCRSHAGHMVLLIALQAE